MVLRGDPGDGAFCVVYLREGRLVAIDTVGSLADFRTAKKLIARGAEVDPHLVADPAFTLVDAATLASTPPPSERLIPRSGHGPGSCTESQLMLSIDVAA